MLGVVGIGEFVEDHGELLVLAKHRGILPQGGFAQPPPVSAAVELADPTPGSVVCVPVRHPLVWTLTLRITGPLGPFVVIMSFP